jgi:hypothetical protein
VKKAVSEGNPKIARCGHRQARPGRGPAHHRDRRLAHRVEQAGDVGIRLHADRALFHLAPDGIVAPFHRDLVVGIDGAEVANFAARAEGIARAGEDQRAHPRIGSDVAQFGDQADPHRVAEGIAHLGIVERDG